MLTLSPAARETIDAHSRSGYPLEVCGALLGRRIDGAHAIEIARPIRNDWEVNPELRASFLGELGAAGGPGRERWEEASEQRRFLVSPQELHHCMREARQAGLEVVGIYHTHPDHPAAPSDFDRDAAWPVWSYLIVSVRSGAPTDWRSWVLDEETGQFAEEPVN